MDFWLILLACLAPVVLGFLATMVDEDIAMRGGFHKKHL